MTGRRVAVLGSGANGTSIGVDLARAGVDVTLIEQWPGHVEAIRTTGARVAVGAEVQVAHPPALHLCQVADLLRHSGSVELFGDIRSAKWMKLVSNCSVLVPTAALNLPMADAIEVPGFRALMVAAGQEALDVGVARGHAMLPIFGLEGDDIARPDQVVEVMLDRLYERFVKPGATTTILHDWEKGRRSEAGDLNGLVGRLGRELGVPTPVNDAVHALAREVETGRRSPDPGNARVLLAALG
ncbi:ketopantoate reductase family protein [Nocardioides sp.]|uniref:ketopantoate reductase family protein n=1 Tax=Nocardioides sp. TaxID=35761 RepID=UPI0035292093